MHAAENSELLRQLFLAHSRSDKDGFKRAADLIVRGLVASNRHSEATALQQALKSAPDSDLQSLTRFSRPTTLTSVSEPRITRENVVLPPGARRQVDRVLDEQRQRTKLLSAGLYPAHKLLFWGPPGCGKTLTAAAIASELGFSLVTLRLSSVITSYVGETSANLQRVFERAKAGPTVLLIDEIDAIAKQRDDRNDVGELKRVVNSLLQMLDEFVGGTGILVACTNHQYLLDSAVWRRFDQVIHFPMPSSLELCDFARRRLSGVKLVGSLKELSAVWKRLSFYDVELILSSSLKTLVLNEWAELPVRQIAEETRIFRSSRRGVHLRKP